MNASESVALEWLQNKGLMGITYNAHRSPDFETENGSYEVKTLSNGRLSFTATQTILFASDPTLKILIVHNNGFIEELTYNEAIKKYKTVTLTSVGMPNHVFHKLVRFAGHLKLETGKMVTMSDAIEYALEKVE